MAHWPRPSGPPRTCSFFPSLPCSTRPASTPAHRPRHEPHAPLIGKSAPMTQRPAQGIISVKPALATKLNKWKTTTRPSWDLKGREQNKGTRTPASTEARQSTARNGPKEGFHNRCMAAGPWLNTPLRRWIARRFASPDQLASLCRVCAAIWPGAPIDARSGHFVHLQPHRIYCAVDQAATADTCAG